MTKKQKLFCEEYLIDLNATQSAIRVRLLNLNATRLISSVRGSMHNFTSEIKIAKNSLRIRSRAILIPKTNE